MKFEFLKLVKCPYCDSYLETEYILDEKDDELINGLVKCECSHFPILKGILILTEGYSKYRIVELVREGRNEEAIMRCLWPENFGNITSFRQLSLPAFLGLPWTIGTFLSRIAKKRISRKLYRQYSNRSVSFFDLMGNSPSDEYFKHRFSTDSFWSIYPFIPILKKKNERILDLNCGVGHGSFVLSDYGEPRQLVSLDKEFRHLYLAKKYFSSDSQFICHDSNFPLPFENGIFSSIVISDALHYVRSRNALVREMNRILSAKSLLLLLHVHNALTFNLGAGFPLSPNSCIDILRRNLGGAQIAIKAMPEKKVIHDFLLKNKLDLMAKYSEDELNSSNALVFFATHDRSLITAYSNIDREFLKIKDNLIINPLYRIKEEADKILLKCPDPALPFDYFPFSEKYLVRKYAIDKRYAKGRLISGSNPQVATLMRKFIAINVPKGYM